MPQGRRFGKYLLHDKLAVGGMGELYLATVVGAAKGTPPSVLKILLPEYGSDADFVSMFHDEARIGMQLEHPNVVAVKDLGRVQDTPYLVMEYVHGENLRNVARRMAEIREKFPPEIAVRVAVEVLHGLEYSHNAKDSRGRPLNLVHRDLSPDNVMLSFDGDVKILDFGIAKAEGRATSTQFGILKGKAQYMAPEQALGQPVDGRTDLYAVGLVLLEVITGERRFSADTDPIQQIRDARTWRPTEPSKRDPTLPLELDAILLKALQLEPKRRFQSAAEFADALTKLLREGSLPRTPDNVPRLMRRLFPDRAEPFLLFEETEPAPKPEPKKAPVAAKAKVKPAPEPEPAPAMEMEMEGELPSESTLLGAFLGGTGGRTKNPEQLREKDRPSKEGARPGKPSEEATRPPARPQAKAIGAIDEDTQSGAALDDGRTAVGVSSLDEPTREGTPLRAARPSKPSEEDTENSRSEDLDDRTAVGVQRPPARRDVPPPPPPASRASREETAPPRRPASTPKTPPKFREAPPPPPAKFRDVRNLRDLPDVPGEDSIDEVGDGTRVVGADGTFVGDRGPSRVSTEVAAPARVVERRRDRDSLPSGARERPRKKGGAGRVVLWLFFLVLFGGGIGAGLLMSGLLPPEITARFEPLFAAVPILRPPEPGGGGTAVLGSGQQIAMASPVLETPVVTATPEDGDDDDDDEPAPTGNMLKGGGCFMPPCVAAGGDDDDDEDPAPTRSAVAVTTPRGTERPPPTPRETPTPRVATPRPTPREVATPRATPVVSTSGKAMVKVISTPAGIDILVDGIATGKKTPATVPIEPGTRTISLKAPGFRPWSFKETFQAGDTLQLPVDLQPL